MGLLIRRGWLSGGGGWLFSYTFSSSSWGFPQPPSYQTTLCICRPHTPRCHKVLLRRCCCVT